MKSYKLMKLACAVTVVSLLPIYEVQSAVAESNPLFSIPSLEAAKKTHEMTPSQSRNSSKEVNAKALIDPMLEKIRNQQGEDKLKAEIDKLKLENKRLKERQGVERQEIPAVPASVLTDNVPK